MEAFRDAQPDEWRDSPDGLAFAAWLERWQAAADAGAIEEPEEPVPDGPPKLCDDSLSG